VRAFLPTPVPDDILRRLIEAGARAPSGSNIQPWHAYVLGPQKKRALSAAMHEWRATHPRGAETAQYRYYPVKWREPYLARRRATGWGLYSLLGIGRDDKEKMFRQHGRNFDFFDAPAAMIFTIERDMELGSWIDYGMFLENMMVAARGFGLHTCAQAAWEYHHDVVRAVLGLPEAELVVCGMAIGYEDEAAPENRLRTEREPVERFTTFLD
jgi:nitroreductase